MTEIARVPAGVATGGQFATTARAEADVALTRATRIYDPANVDGRRLAAGRILIVETAKVGGEIMPGGHPHARAVNEAVASRLQRAGGQELEDQVFALAKADTKVTILLANRNGLVQAREGTLSRSASGNLSLIDKGSRVGKGALLYRSDQHPDARWLGRPLAVRTGYGHLGKMADTWRETAAKMPATVEAHYDGIPVWDGEGEPPSQI